MLRFLLYLLLAWFLYNLIFKFIIPVYRASKQMRQQFKKMQETMQEQQRQYQEANGGFSTKGYQPSTPPKTSANKGGEYIDFEEVK